MDGNILILLLILWFAVVRARRKGARKGRKSDAPVQGSDFSATRAGVQDHLNKRREKMEKGG